MQELAPTPSRVDLVLQYLQERPTPLLGENNNNNIKQTPKLKAMQLGATSFTLVGH